MGLMPILPGDDLPDAFDYVNEDPEKAGPVLVSSFDDGGFQGF